MNSFAELICPKCQAKMEIGFIADSTYGGKVAPVWYSGPLKWSFWTGLGLRNRVQRHVQSARCSQCGYLESYAR